VVARSHAHADAGAAAAALLVAVVLWHRQPSGEPPVLEAQHAAEDMDLLADSEALELLMAGTARL